MTTSTSQRAGRTSTSRRAGRTPTSGGDLPSTASTASTAATAATALGLVGLLAVASGGTSLLAPSGGGGADRTAILLVVAVLAGLGLAVAGAVVLVLRRITRTGPGDAAPLRVAFLRALPITTFAVAVASLLVISRGDLRRAGDPSGATGEFPGNPAGPLGISGWWSTAVKAGEGETEPEGAGAADPDGDRRRVLLLLFVGAVGTVVAGAVLWRVTRSPDEPDDEIPEDDGRREAAHGAVVGTIDAMLSDPDPNTAIIGAYARLLEGLARCGTARRHYEGPMEHLHRVLAVLDVRPGPLGRLIELFELARFSSHRLTPAHRDEALDALGAVAADLAVSTASGDAETSPRPERAPVGGRP